MIMPTLRDYREQAGLSLSEMARRANVDFKTAKKAEDGTLVTRIKAVALVRAINQALGLTLRPEEIENLNME